VVKEEIYDYKERLQRYRRIIKGLRNGELALSFLDHLLTLELSEGRVSAYASHIPAILRVADFNLAGASRKDIEKVVAWINSQPYSESTKRDKKITLKKLVQYARYGNCDSSTPYPKEVAWIEVNTREKSSRTTPEALLSHGDFEALVKATDNARDKALVYTLFEGALRPGELLGMSVGSVEFKDRYCLITVNGKTGLKRVPLVASYKPLLEWLEQLAEDVKQLKASVAFPLSSQQSASQQLPQSAQPSAAAPQEPSSAQGHVPQTSAPPESSQSPSLKGGFLACRKPQAKRFYAGAFGEVSFSTLRGLTFSLF
jgi:integrase